VMKKSQVVNIFKKGKEAIRKLNKKSWVKWIENHERKKETLSECWA
jgi:hypothetical protein